MRKPIWIISFLLVPAFMAVLAQNDMHANVNLQFRFDNPGARAQAIGGAFVGLADDTTAIFANPAGLITLSSNTAVLEASQVKRDNNIPFYGGSINQTDLQDFEFNLQEREFPEDTFSVPFFGYVNAKSRVKWGFFYAEQANFQRGFETEGLGVPPYADRPVDLAFLIFFPRSVNKIDMEMTSLGGSVAFPLGDHWSFGATISYSRLDYRGTTNLIVTDPRPLFPELNIVLPPGFVDLIGETEVAIDVDGQDEAVSFFAGLLYRPNERFSMGLVYKKQPEFDYDFMTSAYDVAAGGLQPVDQGAAVFNVPDSFAAGFSFKPTETFLVSVEARRVRYSDLTKDFQTFFNTENDPAQHGQVVEDSTEYHAGVEYLFINTAYPLAVRAGYWFEPYHALKNTNLDTQIIYRYLTQGGDFVEGFRQSIFLQRFEEDLNHVTFGMGVTFGQHFAMDVAGDISSADSRYSISAIYRY